MTTDIKTEQDTIKIDDPQISGLLQELCQATNLSVDEVIRTALETSLELQRSKQAWKQISDVIDSAGAKPALDDRPESEIVGYDEHGIPA